MLNKVKVTALRDFSNTHYGSKAAGDSFPMHEEDAKLHQADGLVVIEGGEKEPKIENKKEKTAKNAAETEENPPITSKTIAGQEPEKVEKEPKIAEKVVKNHPKNPKNKGGKGKK